MKIDVVGILIYVPFYIISMLTLASEGITIDNYKWWLIIMSMMGLAICNGIRESLK